MGLSTANHLDIFLKENTISTGTELGTILN